MSRAFLSLQIFYFIKEMFYKGRYLIVFCATAELPNNLRRLIGYRSIFRGSLPDIYRFRVRWNIYQSFALAQINIIYQYR